MKEHKISDGRSYRGKTQGIRRVVSVQKPDEQGNQRVSWERVDDCPPGHVRNGHCFLKVFALWATEEGTDQPPKQVDATMQLAENVALLTMQIKTSSDQIVSGLRKIVMEIAAIPGNDR